MWNVDQILESLRGVRMDAEGRWPAGAPAHDFLRSPAAAQIGALSRAEGLFLFHYEHRFELDLPDEWVAEGAAHSAEAPRWHDGVLPERKYQSFRHDLMIGGFHPGHRSKWTTHELCHALVGFGWGPRWSVFEHATACRLAELLPVLLYYFFDEVQLTRCPEHADGGALYRSYCAQCEAVAAVRMPSPADREFVRGGLAFLDAELAAVAKSRRLGRPVSYLHGTLDLCSDGVAYAHAHGRRLSGRAMERLGAFFGAECSSTLDDLEARVVEVTRALLLGAPLSRRNEGGASRWVAQDLAFRMLTVWEQAEGEVAAEIGRLVDRLQGGELDLYADWEALEADYVLPTAAMIFGVGYPLSKGGSMVEQVRDGLRTVAPLVLNLGEDAGLDLAAAFVRMDPSVRVPLGERFAGWLEVAHPQVAQLGALECAMRTVRVDPLLRLGPVGEGIELAAGVKLFVGTCDLLELAERVDDGSVIGRQEEGRLQVDLGEPVSWALAVSRALDGELCLVELPVDAAEALLRRERVEPEIERSLLEVGVLRPARF